VAEDLQSPQVLDAAGNPTGFALAELRRPRRENHGRMVTALAAATEHRHDPRRERRWNGAIIGVG
jgi:hypothetical protein